MSRRGDALDLDLESMTGEMLAEIGAGQFRRPWRACLRP